jgi:hypothetical protein
MQDGELTLEETAAASGATTRNIKYWTVVYDLEVHRRGRRNFYPARTVELIRAITRLSELQIHTTHFTRWLVDLALDRDLGDPDRYARFQALCSEIGDLLGVAPPVKPGSRARDLARATIPSATVTRSGADQVSARRAVGMYGDEESVAPLIARRHARRDDESLL